VQNVWYTDAQKYAAIQTLMGPLHFFSAPSGT